jgi:hypothetical protein
MDAGCCATAFLSTTIMCMSTRVCRRKRSQKKPKEKKWGWDERHLLDAAHRTPHAASRKHHFQICVRDFGCEALLCSPRTAIGPRVVWVGMVYHVGKEGSGRVKNVMYVVMDVIEVVVMYFVMLFKIRTSWN